MQTQPVESSDGTGTSAAAFQAATSRIADLAAQLQAEAGCKHVAVRQAAAKLVQGLRGPAEHERLSCGSSQAVAELVTVAAQSEASSLMACGLHVLLASLPVLRFEAGGEVSRTICFSLSLVATHAKGRLDVAVLCAFACCCCAGLLPLDAIDACLLLNALLRLLATTPSCARTAMGAAVRAFVTVIAGGPISAVELASNLMLAVQAQASSGPLRRLIASYTPLLHHPRLEQQHAPELHVAVFLELAHIAMDADQDASAPAALDCLVLLLRHLPADASIFTRHECEARFACCVDDLDAEQSLAVLTTLLTHRHLRMWARHHIASRATEIFDGHAPRQLLHACERLHQEVSSDTPPQPLMHLLFSFADDDDRGAVITTLAQSLHHMADDAHLSNECAAQLLRLSRSFCEFLDETLAPAALHLRTLQLARLIPAVWPRLHAALGAVQQRAAADDGTVASCCARALRSLLHVCGAVFSDVASDVACDAQIVLASSLAGGASQSNRAFPLELVLEATHAGRLLQSHCWTDVWASVLTLHASREGAAVDALLATISRLPSDAFVAALSAMATAASAALDAQSPDAWLLERLVTVVDSSAANLGVAWRLAGNAFLAPFAADEPRPATQLVAAAAYSCAVETLLQRSCDAPVRLLQTPEARSKGVSLMSPALRIAELGTDCDEVYELLARLCTRLLSNCGMHLTSSTWAAILDLCGHAATLRCGEPVHTAFYFALESGVTALQGSDVLYESEPRGSLLAALFAWSRQPNTSRALDAIGLIVVLAPRLGVTPLSAEATGCSTTALPPPPPSTPARTADAVGHTTALSGLASVALCRECGAVVRIEALTGLFDCAAGCSATHAWTSAEWLHVLADYICVVLDGLLRERASQVEEALCSPFLLTVSCLVIERTCGLFEQLDWHVMAPCLEGVAHMLCTCLALPDLAFSQHAAAVLVRLAGAVATSCDGTHWAIILYGLAAAATPRVDALTAAASIAALSRYTQAATTQHYGAALLALVEAVVTAMRSSRSVEVQAAALDVLVCTMPVPAATQACVAACVALVEQPVSRNTEVALRALRVLEAAPLDAVAQALPSLLRRKLSLGQDSREGPPDGA